MNIQDCKLKRKVFKEDRFYAILEKSFHKRKRIPYANYLWLMSNPTFDNIPKGYVVHHLDWDRTNDDITNLVIMQKHQHISHHWKNIKIKTEVKISDIRKHMPERIYFPKMKPRCHYDKKSERWFVVVTETIDGERAITRLFRYNGKKMSTEGQAGLLIDEIWTPEKQQWAEAG